MPIKILESPHYTVLDSIVSVPFLRGTERTIDASAARKALSKSVAAKRVGCYIFAIKNGSKFTPWYVGKATKGFAQEVFNTSNCVKYAEAFGLKKAGTGQIIFVAAPKTPGAINKKAIGKLEKYLIELCALENAAIRNSRNITVNKFVIAGVINGGAGKRSKSAGILHTMLGRD